MRSAVGKPWNAGQDRSRVDGLLAAQRHLPADVGVRVGDGVDPDDLADVLGLAVAVEVGEVDPAPTRARHRSIVRSGRALKQVDAFVATAAEAAERLERLRAQRTASTRCPRSIPSRTHRRRVKHSAHPSASCVVPRAGVFGLELKRSRPRRDALRTRTPGHESRTLLRDRLRPLEVARDQGPGPVSRELHGHVWFDPRQPGAALRGSAHPQGRCPLHRRPQGRPASATWCSCAPPSRTPGSSRSTLARPRRCPAWSPCTRARTSSSPTCRASSCCRRCSTGRRWPRASCASSATSWRRWSPRRARRPSTPPRP